MTDELKWEILQLLRENLIIKIEKDSDYYGNYTTHVKLYLWGKNYDELISESYC
jgi:hypothetical protein